MAEKFDVVVIGGGPGGYSAAIRCAQNNSSVALIEKGAMGGTCLNVGCIPSKALLASAHTIHIAKSASIMGVEISDYKINWQKMQARKNSIVQGFVKGLTGLVNANKIKIFEGRGIAKSQDTVEIQKSDGSAEQIQAAAIILATGSVPIEIPSFPFDGKTIIDSAGALSLEEIPESMVIIGGGVIGCEMACVYSSVGTKVTIVEALDRLIPKEDQWVGKMLEREFKKMKIDVLAGKKVSAVETANMADVKLESGETIQAEKVLVCVGRRAICDQETVDALSLEMNGSAIKINEKMQTNVPNVYAIGDAVATTYLAHGAFAEAEVAAANAIGSNASMHDYSLVPRAVYSFPEIASVGRNEQYCIDNNIEYTVGRSFFKANGRSVGHNETTGEIRAIRETSSNKIIGVVMVGANVTELAAAATPLIGTSEEIAHISFAHPTVSEVLKDSMEDAFGISLHLPPKKA